MQFRQDGEWVIGVGERLRVAMSGFLACGLLAGALASTGCAAKRGIASGVQDVSPPVVSSPLPMAERMVVGIARFSNETTYGSGLFVDEHGDRIGKQASDCLAKHLVATQRFRVVERQDLGRIKQEADLKPTGGDFRQQLTGAEALIVGSVVELGRETTGTSILVGKSKQQRARARVVLRLMDAKTGEVFASAEGTGEATVKTSSALGFGGQAAYDSTLEGKAIDAAIVNMMNNIVTNLDARRGSHFGP